MELLEERRVLASWTVNTPADEFNGVGDLSLREAIHIAVSGDTIDFNVSSVNGATIALTLGQLEVVGETLTIDATMLPLGLTIDAADPSPDPGDGIRIFDVTDPIPGADSPLVTLKGLTLRGGDPLDGFGGAIRSKGRLDVRQCTFIDNEAALSGGAIYATAQLDVVDSKFRGNATSGLGGALYLNLLYESATITRSELSSNCSRR